MSEHRKRSSQAAAEDILDPLDAIQKLSSPSKRARTSSNAAPTSFTIDPLLTARFKQPEHLLGPQICALCERNISKSVKVLCAEDQ